MSDSAAASYLLPTALISRADVARLAREVEALDNELEVQKVRAGDKPVAYHMPTMSKSLSSFVELNKVDLTNGQTRMEFKEHLRVLKDHAPVVHMTFAVEADPEFLSQLVAWMRQNIHPQALVSVGLQPSLVGGVYVRTPNHIHDFSIRRLLATKRDLMVHELEGYHAG